MKKRRKKQTTKDEGHVDSERAKLNQMNKRGVRRKLSYTCRLLISEKLFRISGNKHVVREYILSSDLQYYGNI